MCRALFLFIVMICFHSGNAYSNADSLWSVYNNRSEPDSVRLKAMDELSWPLVFSVPDSAISLCDFTIGEFAPKGASKGLGQILRNKAVAFIMKGEYNSALDAYQQSEQNCLGAGDLDGLASTYNGYGIVFSRIGQHARSIEYYYKALSCFERLSDKQGMSIAFNNIGLIHSKRQEYDKALALYDKVLAIQKELGNQKGINTALANMAEVYLKTEQFDKSIEIYEQALEGAQRMNDEFMVATVRNNMGGAYADKGDYDKALYHFFYSLPIRNRAQDVQGQIDTYNSIAQVYVKQKDFKKAREFARRSYDLSASVGSPEGIKNSAFTLFNVFEGQRNADSALKYYREFVTIKDSLYNSENTAKLVEEEMRYGFDQREREMMLEQQRRDIVHEESNKRQRLQKIYMGIGLALCMLILLVVWRGLQARKRANKIISEQKELVEEKNKEILDSIRYAQHIQEAILPAKSFMDGFLPEYFIYYLPKDIVSGDFYWAEQFDDLSLFAAVDCTGHGVPGAFVSIVANNNLNRCVKEFGLREPAAILDKLNLLVNETLRQRRDVSSVKDGMDIALCSLRRLPDGSAELQYAGANNSMFLFAAKSSVPEKHLAIEDSESSFAVFEIKPDRQPVGNFLEDYTEPFTNHKLKLHKGESLYILTDGFADQFGGPNGKKYKQSQFKKLIFQNGHLSMQEQRDVLHTAFHTWKGDMEQIDDVCVIGVRV
ncbi:MAG: tetratricopeptide repeat protein [Flavobacteriales bacterium]